MLHRGPRPHALDDCLLAEYNDLEGLAALFQEQGDQIACVIMEPVTLNMTGCMPEPGFLEGLRELCTRYGVLMVFDETLTGFRLALGGAQEYFGVTPDLCTFAKAIGGGFPVAAFAGRRRSCRSSRTTASWPWAPTMAIPWPPRLCWRLSGSWRPTTERRSA